MLEHGSGLSLFVLEYDSGLSQAQLDGFTSILAKVMLSNRIFLAAASNASHIRAHIHTHTHTHTHAIYAHTCTRTHTYIHTHYAVYTRLVA